MAAPHRMSMQVTNCPCGLPGLDGNHADANGEAENENGNGNPGSGVITHKTALKFAKKLVQHEQSSIAEED